MSWQTVIFIFYVDMLVKGTMPQYARSNHDLLPQWCLHLNVVGEFVSFRDPESYAGGSVATSRATHAGQVKG